MIQTFLLVNDDGIDAIGLQTLIGCVGEMGQIITVAPFEHVSGCGHQVTSRVPIGVEIHLHDVVAHVPHWLQHITNQVFMPVCDHVDLDKTGS